MMKEDDLIQSVVQFLDDKKAINIKVLDLSGLRCRIFLLLPLEQIDLT